MSLKAYLIRTSLLIPIIILLTWSFFPIVKTFFATSSITRLQKNGIIYSPLNEQKRKLQFHFSRYGIYVPFNDIISKSSLLITEQKIYKDHIKIFGRSNIYIWLPLKIRIPLLGEKVYEWCFKL